MLSIGTISRGTLRPEDIAAALADALRKAESTDYPLLSDLDAIAEDSHMDHCDDVLNDAADALQDYAPPFCYVGAHESDGSDIGVWPDFDAIDMAVADGEAIRVTDLAELDSLDPAEMPNTVFLVNDHGNLSVYSVSLKPETTLQWDCV